MPRKTKKEKKLSDARKNLTISFVEKTELKTQTDISKKTIDLANTKITAQYKASYQETTSDLKTRTETIHDAIKTCVIIGLILLIQISLFIFRHQIPVIQNYL